jgi:hypothetical protein
MLATLNSFKKLQRVKRKIKLDREFETIDYKVAGRIDELPYQRDPKLWEHLPRCFCVIKNNNKVLRIVAGLRKFGNAGDFHGKLQSGEVHMYNVYANKANGEYFSFSCFIDQNITYFVYRSKNVTMVTRKDNFDEDFKCYQERRYAFTREMAIQFNLIFNNLSTNQQDEVIKMCSEHTINMESCSPDHQHLVDYNGKYLMLPFALTKYEESSKGLTSMLPCIARDWFEKVGFSSLSYYYKTVNKIEEQKIRDQVFGEKNSEGAVVYRICKTKDGELKVYHIYKYKNYKYIFWRAVRERMRGRTTITTMMRRFKNFHVEIPNIDTLTQEALKFYAFIYLTTSPANWEDMMSKWITQMKKYDELTEQEKEDYLKKFEVIDRNRTQVQLMFIGIPGSGKSTVSKCLDRLIPESARVNQDECNGMAKIYHKNIKKLSYDDKVKVLLLDKSHHSEFVRKNARNVINMGRLVYVVLHHPNDKEFELATARINKRGKGHLSLHPSNKLEGILKGFMSSSQKLSDEELKLGQIIKLNMTYKPVKAVRYLIDELNKMKLINVKVTDGEIDAAYKKVYAAEKNLASKPVKNNRDSMKSNGRSRRNRR